MWKTYLIDWDGCMAKTLDVWMDAYMSQYAAEGILVTPQEIIEKSWGNLQKGPQNFGVKNPEETWKSIIEKVHEGVLEVPLYDGVYDTLHTLSTLGVNIAIVTSSERKLVEPAINYHGLSKFIDVIVTEEDVQHPKPDPEIIHKALERMEVDKTEVVIIGDTGKDILAGINAEIDTVLVCHDENHRYYDFTKFLELNPTRVISKFSELSEY